MLEGTTQVCEHVVGACSCCMFEVKPEIRMYVGTFQSGGSRKPLERRQCSGSIEGNVMETIADDFGE